MEQFTVKIKPLTPIWSGNENKKCRTLRETGILGSLRWWYEVLIRGLDGAACDPSNSNCNGKNHCDACELFGCNGWARKFKLETKFNDTIPAVLIGTRKKRMVRTELKYLKRNITGFMSNEAIILKFVPLKKITSNEWALLNKTLLIISNYGALGSKISQGNGVIEIVENSLPYKDKKPEKLELTANTNKIDLPNLNNFFFFKFDVMFEESISELINKNVFWTHASDDRNFRNNWRIWKKLWNDYRFLPIALHIRDAIRHLENDRETRHEIFGIGGSNAKGSKIFVSHCYKISDKVVETRIWGYDVREEIRNEIKEKLKVKLKETLFSNGRYQQYLECCILKNEKTGNQILEGLK